MNIETARRRKRHCLRTYDGENGKTWTVEPQTVSVTGNTNKIGMDLRTRIVPSPPKSDLSVILAAISVPLNTLLYFREESVQ
jgi:hypothetical protein